jgi:ABC-type Fe3+ transport system substrate-binding protein
MVPNVAQLQTLQDFPKWKAEGVFLNYKPIGWENLHDECKEDGFYYAILHIYAFSNVINTNLLPKESQWPLKATDYLKPEFNNNIVATYPHDDDAVLYCFNQVVDKYGWEYTCGSSRHKMSCQIPRK